MSDWEPLRPLLLAFALLVAPAIVVWDGWTYIQLCNDGVTTPAVVTGKTRTYSRRSTDYHVEYRFRDDAGRRWSGSQSIGRDLYARLQVSQRLDIVYSRSRPDWNVAYIDVLRERIAFLSFVSLVIALLAGSAAWWWSYARRKTLEYDADMRRVRTA